MRCPNCKKPITEEMDICPHCGAYCSHVEDTPVSENHRNNMDLSTTEDFRPSNTHVHGDDNSEEEIMGEIDFQKIPEEQGTLEKEQSSNWLRDNTQMLKEELSDENTKETAPSFKQPEISSEDRKIAQECWDEFEEETTHNHIISENEKHKNTSNQLFYSNLHPKTRSGKFTIILILMALLILIFPNIENRLTLEKAQAEKKSTQETEVVDEKSSDSVGVEKKDEERK